MDIESPSGSREIFCGIYIIGMITPSNVIPSEAPSLHIRALFPLINDYYSIAITSVTNENGSVSNAILREEAILIKGGDSGSGL